MVYNIPNLEGTFVSGTYLPLTHEVDVAFGCILSENKIFGPFANLV